MNNTALFSSYWFIHHISVLLIKFIPQNILDETEMLKLNCVEINSTLENCVDINSTEESFKEYIHIFVFVLNNKLLLFRYDSFLDENINSIDLISFYYNIYSLNHTKSSSGCSLH